MSQNPSRRADTEDLEAAVEEARKGSGDLAELARKVQLLRQDNERLFQQLMNDERRIRRLARAVWRVQEAVSNALKHAEADEVKILLERRSGRRTLYLRVSDDGRGFDADATLAGHEKGAAFGLRGIRDRIQLLGGFFRLASRPDEGTQVEIELPLYDPESEAPL